MMKVVYSEMDTPAGISCRLEAAGHAGYAPAGQDIVCAGASTVMQGLVCLLAGEESARSDAFDEPDGPRLAVQADAPCAEWVQGAFELAKACFALLAERYPENVRFADVSRRGEKSMMDLQLFANEGGDAAPAPPALSEAQTRQAVASGTMKPGEAAPAVPAAPQPEPEARPEPPVQRPELPPLSGLARSTRTAQPGNAPSDAAARDAGAGRLPPDPLRRKPAHRCTGGGTGGGGADPAARRTAHRKRHPSRRCGHRPPGCCQHDPRPARSTGTPCAPRSTDRTVTF